MIIHLLIGFFVGLAVFSCSCRVNPHLPQDALIGLGVLAQLFTQMGFIGLKYPFGDGPQLFVLAPLFGILVVAAISIFSLLLTRLLQWLSRKARNLRQIYREYVFHRYLDSE